MKAIVFVHYKSKIFQKVAWKKKGKDTGKWYGKWGKMIWKIQCKLKSSNAGIFYKYILFFFVCALKKFPFKRESIIGIPVSEVLL